MIDLANTRVLLTGAHGSLGGYVYEQLIAPPIADAMTSVRPSGEMAKL